MAQGEKVVDDVNPAPAVTVVTGDRLAPATGPRLPVVLVLDRLRSAYNVGNLFRLAEAVQAERLVACGYTACPPHPKLVKTARGCDLLVPCEHQESAAEAVQKLRREGYAVYVVETVAGARAVWDVPLRFPAAFVFGNEALGVTPAALGGGDAVVALPCFGVKNSINVANCAAVVLYEAVRQWSVSQAAAEHRVLSA